MTRSVSTIPTPVAASVRELQDATPSPPSADVVLTVAQRRALRPPLTHKRFYIQRRLTRCVLRMIDAYPEVFRGGTVVDYGCGDMPYRPFIEPAADRYCGVDLPSNDAAQACLHADGTTPYADASADVVLSTQVLEHVDSPTGYLAEAWRILRPGGTLMLSTHGIWWHHPHPQDLWRWTGEGLQRVLGEAGFTTQRFEGVCNLAAAGVYLLQDGTYGRLPQRGPLRPAYFAVMQSLAAAVDRVGIRDRHRMAAIFVVLATKDERTPTTHATETAP
ncbi:MAG: class I SAM-dependent methyltransferase [Planctomycetota bacterium]